MHTARYETGPSGYHSFPAHGAFAAQSQPPGYGTLTPPPLPPSTPVRGSRTGMTVLIALAALFLVTTGIFVTLFLIAASDHTKTVTQLDDRQRQLTELDDRVAAAEADRKRAEERNTAVKSANADISGCVKAMQHYLWDGLAEAQRTAAARDLLTKCK
ncbi:hypothetical protein [Kibdelosporangium aridum]|uniref:Uncharacterized protein n=1 Tax=Kibdelosporangium aridum TaxID=2030 RepID=A0A1Y5Y7A8_KIBAR|nr:hypothetical protein [Kibdelosporangium aridum]SMD25461.1 hypothetical protein SAMN05661093_09147 [Kibdelosporangium aridum]